MKIKRSVESFLIIGLFISMFLISVVSAQGIGQEVSNIIDNVVEAIEPFAKYILGESVGIGNFSAGEILFAKVLFFIIVLGIILASLSNIDFFTNKSWVYWTVSIGVSILAIRFLGNTLVPMIILPYSVLGVVISAGLPFVIYFIIVEVGMKGDSKKTVRKIAWVFFAVIFLALWVVRSESLGEFNWIYPVTALASILVLFIDGTIQKILAKIAVEKASSINDRRSAMHWRAERKKIDEDYKNNPTTYVSLYTDTTTKGSKSHKADIDFINAELVKLKT